MAPNRKVDRLLSSRMLESPSSGSSSLFVLKSYSGTSSPSSGSPSAVSTSSSSRLPQKNLNLQTRPSRLCLQIYEAFSGKTFPASFHV